MRIFHLQENSHALPDDLILNGWTGKGRPGKKAERRKKVELTIIPVSTEIMSS